MTSNEGYEPSLPRIGDVQKIEAIIDYIATTPQNINYNMLREMLRALYNNKTHPYFDYYFEKIRSLSEEPGEIIGPTEPGILDPGGGSFAV